MPRTIDPKKTAMLELASLRPIIWAPQTLQELRNFPKMVKQEFGRALQFAQAGDKHPAAKPLRGFGGGGILEIVEDYDRVLIERSIRFASSKPCTCSTSSKRNRKRESRRRGLT
ncbi:MAG: type II toxin-antitoxin system RelE/ParE family toxin [Candidatus Binatus sp.]